MKFSLPIFFFFLFSISLVFGLSVDIPSLESIGNYSQTNVSYADTCGTSDITYCWSTAEGTVCDLADISTGDLTDDGTYIKNYTNNGYWGWLNRLVLSELPTQPSTPPADNLFLYAFDYHGNTVLDMLTNEGDFVRLGRDNMFIAKNDEGGTISKGQCVYISGSTGNVPDVKLTDASNVSEMPCSGVAHESFDDGEFAHIIFAGRLGNFDTSSFTEGDVVYVSPDGSGALTNVQPTYPNISQRIGVVGTSGVGNGNLLIQINTQEGEGYFDDAYYKKSEVDNNLSLYVKNNTNLEESNITVGNGTGIKTTPVQITDDGNVSTTGQLDVGNIYQADGSSTTKQRTNVHFGFYKYVEQSIYDGGSPSDEIGFQWDFLYDLNPSTNNKYLQIYLSDDQDKIVFDTDTSGGFFFDGPASYSSLTTGGFGATGGMSVSGDSFFSQGIYSVYESAELGFGEENNASMKWDGTNLLINTSRNGTGLAYFSNNISTTGVITRTYTTDITDEEAYELYIYADENFYKDGVKNYSVWGECYTPYSVTDYSRPEIEYYNKTFYNETSKDFETILANRTIYPYTKLEDGINLECKQTIIEKAMRFQTGGYTRNGNVMDVNDTLKAEHFVTNTTKDPATLTKVENFYNLLGTKTYQEMKDMILTPEGKLSNDILFNYEQSEYGSYNLEAIGHTNRAMNVLMLWKIKQNEQRLDDIEQTLCNQGVSKYCN